MTKITHYYGTDTIQAGHFFRTINSDGQFNNRTNEHLKLPFSPEEIVIGLNTGRVNWMQSKSAYGNITICAIAGSCSDNRRGCKTVFWIYEIVPFEKMKEIIMNTEICKEIINKMTFNIYW